MFILTGKVYKEGSDWLIECPAIDGMTFGKTKNDALAMMVDYVKCLDETESLEATIKESNDEFELSVSDYRPILRRMFSLAKANTDFTFEDIANSLGLSSRSSVSKTMKVKHDIQVSKLVEFAESLGCDLEVIFKPKKITA